MAVGNQSTVTGINQALTSYSTQLRNLMSQIQDFNHYVGKLGVTGLEDPNRCSPGFPSAANPANPNGVSDAQDAVNRAAILNTLAAVYYGTATQATAYNFDDALASLWGGN